MFGLLLLIAAGAAAYALVQAAGGPGPSVSTDLEATLLGWQNVNEGPTWVPVINQTEQSLGIPANLLARMAFQESSFLPDVIDGTQPSSAGALGILQLEPQFNSTAAVPVPFSAADTQAQITQAGQDLVANYNEFNDWGLAVAAYNAGATAVKNAMASGSALPTETQDYVSNILADVPVPTALVTGSTSSPA